jgi:transposase-like protein
MASLMPESMHWNCDTNFKLKIIKHAEETNNCAMARKFGVAEPYVQHWRKQDGILKGANST